MDLGIKGRTALITGGSKGIGFAIAEQLAEEGCNVILVARSADDLAAARDKLLKKWKVDVRVLKGVNGDGEGFLLIDDLVDTGRTARAVRQLLPKAYFATLYAKPSGRPIVDTCVREFKQNKWIHFPWDIDYHFATPIKDGGKVKGGPG